MARLYVVEHRSPDSIYVIRGGKKFLFPVECFFFFSFFFQLSYWNALGMKKREGVGGIFFLGYRGGLRNYNRNVNNRGLVGNRGVRFFRMCIYIYG